MSTAPQIAADSALFAQALEVLQSERPTPAAKLAFRILNWIVLGAILLTLLYLIQVYGFGVTLENAQPIAVAAAVLYVLIIPVATFNLPFYLQLRRTDTLEREFRPTWQNVLNAITAEPNRQSVQRTFGRVAMIAGGILALVVGAAGLGFESARQEFLPDQFAVALVITVFGLTAVLLPFVARGRERLEIIDALHEQLERGDIAAYDKVAAMHQRLVRVDRKRERKAEVHNPDAYRYIESDAVRDVKLVLSPARLIRVLSHVSQLIAHPPRPNSVEEQQPHFRLEAIEDADLELGYWIDHGAREIRLRQLTPPEESGDVARQPEPATTGYRVQLETSAQTLEQRFSAEQRLAADALIGLIAQNPGRYEPRVHVKPDGSRILHHPSPSLVIEYRIDAAEKTITIVDVSAPMPAARNLFISYASENKATLERIMKFIRQLETQRLVNFWWDGLIEAGQDWNASICSAIDRCQGALLLVSQEFIDSEFINEIELPRLLDRADRNVTTIFWIPLSPSTVFRTHARIAARQSLLDNPKVPLSELEKLGKAEDALVAIHERLERALVKDQAQLV